MEHPQKLAGDHIEGANIARRRQVSLSRGAAQNENVLKDAACATGCQRSGGPVQASLQVEFAVIGEGVHELAGRCIDGLQEPA